MGPRLTPATLSRSRVAGANGAGPFVEGWFGHSTPHAQAASELVQYSLVVSVGDLTTGLSSI